MKTSEIRQSFLDFFKTKNHELVSSSSLVPSNDETLLFTNAGMVQFKDVFLGTEKKNYKRATTSQKCIRAGGKHNDLENVGYTPRHHTFFEMLGNFSFGDYFKEEAIKFAWEFLTDVLKLDKDKLWITVYKDDDEAEEIWKNIIGIDSVRIARLGDEDNFWSMGDTGPCGPCSEIFYDHGNHIEGTPPGAEGDEGDRFVEIWNLVFMQFNRDESGKMKPLPKPSVDTGMGLERIAAVMQGVNSNYETDTFKDLIIASEKLLGNENSTSHKVIADHIRSTVFLIADGVLPENEGRGYVLRRIMRRGIRHGYKIGAKKPFMFNLVKDMVRLMSPAFSDLESKEKDIVELVKTEEKKFFETLEKGIEILDEAISGMSEETISGDVVFKLHDTFGFPFDLTADIARERDLLIDEERFNECMNLQKETSKASSNFVSKLPAAANIDETKFLGYEELESESKILMIWKDQKRVDEATNKEEVYMACNQTPFYAEGGGQIGDSGTLDSKINIFNTIKENDTIIHLMDSLPKDLTKTFKLSVNKSKRLSSSSNHTATHLLHQALRSILGDHVQQKGSMVSDKYLRFDFSHFSKLSEIDLENVENFVNKKIIDHLELEENRNSSFQDCINDGVIALFGEKYGDVVRSIKFGESHELCGGTHVKNTSEIRSFIIKSESAISTGIRRIEAISGDKAVDYLMKQAKTLKEVSKIVLNDKDPISALNKLKNQNLSSNKKLEKTNNELLTYYLKDLNQNIEIIKDLNFCALELSCEPNVLKNLAFRAAKDLDNLFLVLCSSYEGKAYLMCYISKSLVKSKNLNAQEVINNLGKLIDGHGGGQPFFATATGKNLVGIKNIIQQSRKLI